MAKALPSHHYVYILAQDQQAAQAAPLAGGAPRLLCWMIKAVQSTQESHRNLPVVQDNTIQCPIIDVAP